MIIVSNKVKKTVDYDAVKFYRELNPKERSVLAHRVYGNKQISRQSLTLAVIKSDNVSIIIVLQIFYIDIQNIIIGTKYNGNVT